MYRNVCICIYTLRKINVYIMYFLLCRPKILCRDFKSTLPNTRILLLSTLWTILETYAIDVNPMNLYKKVSSLKVCNSIIHYYTYYYLLYRLSIILNNCLADIFTPNFVEIKSRDVCEVASTLKKQGIKYPFVCKPLIAYGSSNAHRASILKMKYIRGTHVECIIYICMYMHIYIYIRK